MAPLAGEHRGRLLQLDVNLHWHTNLGSNRRPDIDVFRLRFDRDDQRVASAFVTTIAFGLIFPSTADGVHTDHATLGKVGGKASPGIQLRTAHLANASTS